ncbi:MAG: hypothetical protein AB7N71_07055 [Phycisphaerae bacterium]
MSRTVRSVIPITFILSTFASVGFAGIVRTRGLDEIEREMQQAQLDHSVWSVSAPQIQTVSAPSAPSLSTFAPKSIARSQTVSRTWMQVATAAEARSSQRRMDTMVYSPGIRSTLVSWSGLLASATPDPMDDIIDAVEDNEVIETPPNVFVPPEGPAVDDPVDNLPMPDIGNPDGTTGIPSPTASFLAIVGAVFVVTARRRL